MSPEIHVVILWSTALDSAERIVADLRARFELVGSYRVEWPPERFGENLRRLYGFALPERVDKTLGSGTDPFLLFVVRDPAPEYGARRRSWGMGLANLATYDAKYRYREWTGGGFRVHTTVSREEAERDVFLLVGRRAETFLEAPALDWDAEPEPLRREVLGGPGPPEREHLLTALELTCGYALVREPDVLLVGARPWAHDLAGGDGAVRLVGGDTIHGGWRRAVIREARRDDRGRRVATPEHAFHVLLHYSLAGELPLEPGELGELARAAGAPETGYEDGELARAVLDDFLHRNRWLDSKPRGRRFLRRG